MYKKYIAITLALVMGVSIMGGCSQTTGSTSEVSTAQVSTGTGLQDAAGTKVEDKMIFGQVSELTDDSITVTVENRQGGPGGGPGQDAGDDESQKQESQGSDTEGSQSQEKDSGDSQMQKDAEGESKAFSITSDTVYEKASMGSQGQAMTDGQPPAKPNEESPDEESADKSDDDKSDSSDQKGSGDQQGSGSQKGSEDQQGSGSQAESGNQQGADNRTGSGNQQGLDSQTGSGNQQGPGQKPDGQPPEMETEEIAASDISEGDTVAIELDDDGKAAKIILMPMGQGGPGGAGSQGGAPGAGGPGGGGSQSAPESYEAVNSYSTDTEVSDETIASTGTDENAVLVSDGASVKISDSKISRSSEDSEGGDGSSFYGTGAAVLTTEGKTYIKNSRIETDANGGAGVFSYGDGVSYVSDTTIRTSQGTSGGIHVAGGGTLYAWDTEVETDGQSSAAIRSDRGGGTMVVDGGSYTSNGTGSPAIYSTADIAVNNARLTANGSEAICIEGNNSIHLYDSDLTGNMKDDSQNDTTWNVILYQSMSGDSEEGNSTFQMDGGSITAKNGGMFYTTNTQSTFTLKDVDIKGAGDAEFFLRCTGNQNQRGWGTTGANGADCLFTAIDQEMEGDIQWDTISELDFYMTEGSTLKGAVVNDESDAGDGGDGYCNLYIDKDSSWIVTGDSTLTSLSSSGRIVDEDGKTVTVKGSDGTVYVKGDSSYTVTVKEYKDSADTSGASTLTAWSEFSQDKPE